jgi:putative glycosyltransferase (TIGR04372 family)
MTPMKGVIDYVHSDFVSDWMDVFLCARCRFFLGNGSGLCAVSMVFGAPCALAHLTPMEAPYAWTPFDVTIPKLLADASGKTMNIREVLNSPIAAYRFTPQFKAAGITHIDNTAEEVRDLALEMMDRLEGKAVYTAEDERLQRTFRSLLRPEHYCYGAVGRIGRDFLRQHAELFDERKPAGAGQRNVASIG